MADLEHSEGFKTGHVGLNVRELDRSIAFYERVFGFEIGGASREEERRFAFLKHGDRLVLTLWQQSQDSFARDRAGLHHLSFEVDSVGKVQEIEARLQEMGAPLLYDGIVPHAEGADSGGIFFEDPDGIRLEVYTTSGVGNRQAPMAGAPSCGFF